VRHANANSDSHANGDAHTDGDANSNGRSYGYVYADCDGNSDGYANGDAYTDGNAYVHTDANGYGYSDSNSYSNGYVHAYGYSDSNSYGNSDLNAYSNCGEAYADTETASNNTATASVVGIGKWNSSGRNSRETLASSPPEVDWLLLIFARSALGVRCVLASLLRRMKLSPQGACVI